jgi:hypothetical protein
MSSLSSPAASSNREYADTYDLLRALLADCGTDACSVGSEGTEQLLLQHRKIKGDQLWSALANEAECHGVAPLIESMITTLWEIETRSRPGRRSASLSRSGESSSPRHRRPRKVRRSIIDSFRWDRRSHHPSQGYGFGAPHLSRTGTVPDAQY